jgi:hypothetical protein
MNILKQGWISLILITAITHSASAEEYQFTYSKLYSQLKYNESERHTRARVGLFFIDQTKQRTCQITKAWMETGKHFETLTTDSHYELMMPIDENLRQANPLVNIITDTDNCSVAMQVMAKKQLQNTVNYNELKLISDDMQELLHDLSGMMSSWFSAPQIIGLTVEFNGATPLWINTSTGKAIKIEQGKAIIDLTQWPSDTQFTLPAKSTKITPYIEK